MISQERTKLPFILFPVTLEVTLTGKSAATDADVSLKRGTVLARIWDGGVAATLGDGEYKYSVLTNWTEIAQSAAEDTGTDSAVDDTFSGFLNNNGTLTRREWDLRVAQLALNWL